MCLLLNTDRRYAKMARTKMCHRFSKNIPEKQLKILQSRLEHPLNVSSYRTVYTQNLRNEGSRQLSVRSKHSSATIRLPDRNGHIVCACHSCVTWQQKADISAGGVLEKLTGKKQRIGETVTHARNEVDVCTRVRVYYI